jgi:drug/metabolite transporter (DMT)-like permease
VALPFDAVSVVPWVFVLLWSTGFIGARLVVGDADPLAVLAVRFALACAFAFLIVLVTRARFMGWKMAGHVAVVGLLLHGVYLGGVFWSIAEGLPAGVSALIVGLQPIVTACLVGALLGERVARLQWIGFAAGLVGIALVLWERLAIGGVGFAAVALSFIALAGITAGALYQKRFCTDVPIWPAAVVQYAAATVLVGIGTLAFEDSRIEWTPKVIGGLAWMVLVLSIGAVSLLMLVIRHSSAAQTASLLYLTPPLAALEAYLIFGEELHVLAIVGLAVAATGVFLVLRGDPAARLD